MGESMCLGRCFGRGKPSILEDVFMQKYIQFGRCFGTESIHLAGLLAGKKHAVWQVFWCRKASILEGILEWRSIHLACIFQEGENMQFGGCFGVEKHANRLAGALA